MEIKKIFCVVFKREHRKHQRVIHIKKYGRCSVKLCVSVDITLIGLNVNFAGVKLKGFKSRIC